MSSPSKPNTKKFYVVWKGRKTGVFSSWEEASAQVTGFTGAQYRGFATLAEARLAFKGSYADSKGKRKSWTAPRPAALPWIEDSYCVDAACSGNPGRLEYRGMHTTTHKLIFHQKGFQDGTNNIGEFLAIVHALAWLKEKGLPQPLYSDSKIGILWVKAKKCKTKLAPNPRNEPVFELVRRAEEWLKSNAYTTQVLLWNTKEWGDIPADFGRK